MKGVGDSPAVGERERAYSAPLPDDRLRLSFRRTDPIENLRSPLLHREVNPLPVARPRGPRLTIVEPRKLPPPAPVGLHDPDVGVLHGRFGGGEAAARSFVDDRSAVGGPL